MSPVSEINKYLYTFSTASPVTLNQEKCVVRQKFRQIIYRENRSIVMTLTQDEVDEKNSFSQRGEAMERFVSFLGEALK